MLHPPRSESPRTRKNAGFETAGTRNSRTHKKRTIRNLLLSHNHPTMKKLTLDQIKEIASLRPTMTMKDLALRFSVSRMTIHTWLRVIEKSLGQKIPGPAR